MNIRKTISILAFLSLVVTILTSLALYIAPQGRVAYWANWRFWALTRDQWGAMHVTLGFLFLLACLSHVYFNWEAIAAFLKKSAAKKLHLFTREFNAALIITVACIGGTYLNIPPFSTIMLISESFKEHAARRYGEPPYGHAELSSLKTFAGKMDLNLEESISALRNAGYHVDNETQTLQTIARINGVSPQKIYQAMPGPLGASAPAGAPKALLPENPAQGRGKMSLMGNKGAQ